VPAVAFIFVADVGPSCATDWATKWRRSVMRITSARDVSYPVDLPGAAFLHRVYGTAHLMAAPFSRMTTLARLLAASKGCYIGKAF
jgi:hypothetical protein